VPVSSLLIRARDNSHLRCGASWRSRSKEESNWKHFWQDPWKQRIKIFCLAKDWASRV
jgi:hypothetical protein